MASNPDNNNNNTNKMTKEEFEQLDKRKQALAVLTGKYDVKNVIKEKESSIKQVEHAPAVMRKPFVSDWTRKRGMCEADLAAITDCYDEIAAADILKECTSIHAFTELYMRNGCDMAFYFIDSEILPVTMPCENLIINTGITGKTLVPWFLEQSYIVTDHGDEEVTKERCFMIIDRPPIEQENEAFVGVTNEICALAVNYRRSSKVGQMFYQWARFHNKQIVYQNEETRNRMDRRDIMVPKQERKKMVTRLLDFKTQSDLLKNFTMTTDHGRCSSSSGGRLYSQVSVIRNNRRALATSREMIKRMEACRPESNANREKIDAAVVGMGEGVEVVSTIKNSANDTQGAVIKEIPREVYLHHVSENLNTDYTRDASFVSIANCRDPNTLEEPTAVSYMNEYDANSDDDFAWRRERQASRERCTAVTPGDIEPYTFTMKKGKLNLPDPENFIFVTPFNAQSVFVDLLMSFHKKYHQIIPYNAVVCTSVTKKSFETLKTILVNQNKRYDKVRFVMSPFNYTCMYVALKIVEHFSVKINGSRLKLMRNTKIFSGWTMGNIVEELFINKIASWIENFYINVGLSDVFDCVYHALILAKRDPYMSPRLQYLRQLFNIPKNAYEHDLFHGYQGEHLQGLDYEEIVSPRKIFLDPSKTFKTFMLMITTMQRESEPEGMSNYYDVFGTTNGLKYSYAMKRVRINRTLENWRELILDIDQPKDPDDHDDTVDELPVFYFDHCW